MRVSVGGPYALLAVDPGPLKHACVWSRVEPQDSPAIPWGVEPRSSFEVGTEHLIELLEAGPAPNISAGNPWAFCVERIATGYKAAGRDLFDTQWCAATFAAKAASQPRNFYSEGVFRSTSAAHVGKFAELGAKGDEEIKGVLLDIYGGRSLAVGGGQCRTCKKSEGWIGRDHADCTNCKGGHGDTGFEVPRGPFWSWSGSHLFAALAVGIVTAFQIQQKSKKAKPKKARLYAGLDYGEQE